MMANVGFYLLGNDAVPAVPGLIQLLETPDKYQQARVWDCLFQIELDKKALLPTILKLLQHKDAGIQHGAALYLRKVYPEAAEKADVYKMFPYLKHSTTNSVEIN